MFGKKYRKKQRRKRQAKPLRKNQVKAVKSMIDNALDDAIEDKFINDVNYHNHAGDWNSTKRSMVASITPVIERGDLKSNRNGDKVSLKFLRCFFRLRPPQFDRTISHIDGTDPSYTLNWVPVMPKYVIRVLKVNRELYGKLSNSEMLSILNVKYRPLGVTVQDVQQDLSGAGTVGIQKLAEFTIRPRWNVTTSCFAPINASVQSTGATDYSFNPTYYPETRLKAVPQDSHHTLLISKKLKQKIVIENSSTTADNVPMKYSYLIHVQCDDRRIDTAYNNAMDSAPQKLETRICWVFEDA